MVHRQQVLELIQQVPNWYHQIELAPGILTPGVNNSAAVLSALQLPADCKGLRALDIGTRDGFFAFELERRGASVLAIDNVPKQQTGFEVAATVLESRVEYVQQDLYDLSPQQYGTFDIVLFLGVLYHLPDPIRGIQVVRSLSRESMFMESYVIDGGVVLPDGRVVSLDEISPLLREVPIAEYFVGDSLGGDATNFWGPNCSCCEAMLTDNGFKVLDSRLTDNRAIFRCVVDRIKK